MRTLSSRRDEFIEARGIVHWLIVFGPVTRHVMEISKDVLAFGLIPVHFSTSIMRGSVLWNMYPIQFYKEIKIMSEIEKEDCKGVDSDLLTRVDMMPEWTAVHAVTYCKYNGKLPDGITTGSLLKVVLDQGRNIKKDQADWIERQLYSQGVALSLMFDRLMKLMSVSNTLKQIEVLGHLALKAQAQSRTAFVALSELNNPNRTTFIKQ